MTTAAGGAARLAWMTLALAVGVALPGRALASDQTNGAAGGGRTRQQANSQDDEGDVRRRLETVGVFIAYGSAQEINGSKLVDIATAGFRWTRVFGLAGEGFLGGRPALSIELLPVVAFEQKPRAFGTGFNIVYGHYFSVDGSVRPVVRLGAGFIFANRKVPVDETRHNFSLLAGIGVDFMVGARSAISVEYRFHHVSNADFGNVNPGINAHTAVLGLTFYFE